MKPYTLTFKIANESTEVKTTAATAKQAIQKACEQLCEEGARLVKIKNQ